MAFQVPIVVVPCIVYECIRLRFVVGILVSSKEDCTVNGKGKEAHDLVVNGELC